MRYIIFNTNMSNAFTGYAKRGGRVLKWKAIQPVEVEQPANRSVLPARVLEDRDIKEAFPALEALPQVDESEIVFKEDDTLLP